MTDDGQHLLRVFFDASLTHQGRAYAVVLMERARAMNIASATAFRVLESYGEAGVAHGGRAKALAPEQQAVVELIDAQPMLKAFVATLELSVEIGLVTLERVAVVGYGGHRHGGQGVH